MRCRGREGMVHASGFCCVWPGMRPGAPRGTREADKGVLRGAARGSCWNTRGKERAREMELRAVFGMEEWVIAEMRRLETARSGAGSMLSPCNRGRLRSRATGVRGEGDGGLWC